MSDALLLCELHAHTTWSDGWLTMPELVDIYGRLGFDVLCITDHAVRLEDPMPSAVDSWTWHAYVYEINREAARALRTYGMLVIPGLELTDNQDDPDESAHAVAIGLNRFVSIDGGIVAAIESARDAGAAIVAAHPYSTDDLTPLRRTCRLSREHESLAGLIDRWELFNRHEVFSWVAHHRLPAVATGDVHRPGDISSWKTLLRCSKDEAAVVEFLRSDARAYLTPFSADLAVDVAAAADAAAAA